MERSFNTKIKAIKFIDGTKNVLAVTSDLMIFVFDSKTLKSKYTRQVHINGHLQGNRGRFLIDNESL